MFFCIEFLPALEQAINELESLGTQLAYHFLLPLCLRHTQLALAAYFASGLCMGNAAALPATMPLIDIINESRFQALAPLPQEYYQV